MHKIALVALATLSLPVSVSAAPLPPPDMGFPSLAVRSANVSHCAKNPAGDWICSPSDHAATAPATDGTLAARVDMLAARVDALSAEIAALQARVDAQEHAAAAPPLVLPRLSKQDAAELERSLGFMETMMRRFFAMVGEMREEASKETPQTTP